MCIKLMVMSKENSVNGESEYEANHCFRSNNRAKHDIIEASAQKYNISVLKFSVMRAVLYLFWP